MDKNNTEFNLGDLVYAYNKNYGYDGIFYGKIAQKMIALDKPDKFIVKEQKENSWFMRPLPITGFLPNKGIYNLPVKPIELTVERNSIFKDKLSLLRYMVETDRAEILKRNHSIKDKLKLIAGERYRRKTLSKIVNETILPNFKIST